MGFVSGAVDGPAVSTVERIRQNAPTIQTGVSREAIAHNWDTLSSGPRCRRLDLQSALYSSARTARALRNGSTSSSRPSVTTRKLSLRMASTAGLLR